MAVAHQAGCDSQLCEASTMQANNTTPMTSTTHTTSKPSLLGLAAELRNHIYNLVAFSTRRAVLNGENLYKHELALGRTCRQIRADYMPMLHHYVRSWAMPVTFTITDLDFRPLMDFIRTCAYLPPDCRLQVHVNLHFTHSSSRVQNIADWELFLDKSKAAEAADSEYTASFAFTPTDGSGANQAIFGSLMHTGWRLGYEADQILQALLQ